MKLLRRLVSRIANRGKLVPVKPPTKQSEEDLRELLKKLEEASRRSGA